MCILCCVELGIMTMAIRVFLQEQQHPLFFQDFIRL